MNKISKFLRKLSKKQFQYIVNTLFPAIMSLDLEGLDIKKMKGEKDSKYRVRYGNIRIIFIKDNGKGVIQKMNFRNEIYK